ncbi:MAG: molecular chaperone GrpE [Actinomycetota bacterium]|jgi:molecular chaperone GrpE|nr:molecular chaperone GrpE [Actinomycetota bacterium]
MTHDQDSTTLAGDASAGMAESSEEVLDGEIVQESSPEIDERQGPETQVLNDLKRLQDDLLLARADYQNLAKQSAKRQADAVARAKARVLEGLLPVLDSFEAAAQHSDDVEGLQLLFKQLVQGLQQQGLEEILAEGKPFDPRVHEAVHMIEDAGVKEPTVKEVYRKGYEVGGQLLRPASVVVANPQEGSEG